MTAIDLSVIHYSVALTARPAALRWVRHHNSLRDRIIVGPYRGAHAHRTDHLPVDHDRLTACQGGDV